MGTSGEQDGVNAVLTATAETGELSAAASAPRRPTSNLPRRYTRVAACMAVTDGIAAVAALLVARLLIGSEAGAGFAGTVAAAPLVWIVTFLASGLYGVRYLSAWEEFRRLIAASSAATVLLTLASVWWRNEADYRPWLALTWALALALALVGRRFWRFLLRHLHQSGYLSRRTLIVGTNVEAATLRAALASPALGVDVLGHVRGDSTPGKGDATVLGGVEDLERLVHELAIDTIVVAATDVSIDAIAQILRVASRLGADVSVSAQLPVLLTSRLVVQPIGRIPTLTLKPVRLSGSQAVVKRALDVVGAAVLLVVTAPLMAAIAIAVKLSSPGPALFHQERVTRNGRVFVVHKFRTMVVDQERALGGQVLDLTQLYFKLENDPRLTPVGRWLRSKSLDELPQLWNVLRGEMSLVGPRALAVSQIRPFNGDIDFRHEVRSGVTGWWQINGRSELEAEQALQMDRFYVENWSLFLDVFILLKTLGVVLRGRGAR